MKLITKELVLEYATEDNGTNVYEFLAQCFDPNEVVTGAQVSAYLRAFSKKLSESSPLPPGWQRVEDTWG